MIVARTAIAARSLALIFGVSVANSTAASTGPMVAKNVVKLVSANSSMALPNGTAKWCGSPHNFSAVYQQSSA